jgi:hypothetical protein
MQRFLKRPKKIQTASFAGSLNFHSPEQQRINIMCPDSPNKRARLLKLLEADTSTARQYCLAADVFVPSSQLSVPW